MVSLKIQPFQNKTKLKEKPEDKKKEEKWTKSEGRLYQRLSAIWGRIVGRKQK